MTDARARLDAYAATCPADGDYGPHVTHETISPELVNALRAALDACDWMDQRAHQHAEHADYLAVPGAYAMAAAHTRAAILSALPEGHPHD